MEQLELNIIKNRINTDDIWMMIEPIKFIRKYVDNSFCENNENLNKIINDDNKLYYVNDIHNLKTDDEFWLMAEKMVTNFNLINYREFLSFKTCMNNNLLLKRICKNAHNKKYDYFKNILNEINNCFQILLFPSDAFVNYSKINILIELFEEFNITYENIITYFGDVKLHNFADNILNIVLTLFKFSEYKKYINNYLILINPIINEHTSNINITKIINSYVLEFTYL